MEWLIIYSKYKGHNIGKSIQEDNCDKIIEEIFSLSKKENCKIIYPEDVSVSKRPKWITRNKRLK